MKNSINYRALANKTGKQLVDLINSKINESDQFNESVLTKDSDQEKLLQIWKDLLGRSDINLTDSFFKVGGTSIKLVQLISRISKVFNVDVQLNELFKNATVEKTSRIIKQRKLALPLPSYRIKAIEEQDYYSVSHAQKRIWVLSQFSEANVAYNINGAYSLKGPLNIKVLENSITEVIRRHESLRTSFKTINGNVFQKILPMELVKFKMSFQVTSNHESNVEKIKLIAANESRRGFVLSEGPLIRVNLIRNEDENHTILFTVHHIISDGWSIELMFKELLDFYIAKTLGNDTHITPLTTQYKDYSSWHNKLLFNKEESKTYWQQKLADHPGTINLPYDKQRIKRGFTGLTISNSLSKELSDKIRALASQESTSIFVVFNVVIKILLFKITGQDDIIIGSPAAGREFSDLQHQIGCYLNYLILRDRIEPEKSVRSLLLEVAKTTTEALEHQNYPFDKIVEDFNIQHNDGRNPFYDVLLVMTPDMFEKELNNLVNSTSLTIEPIEFESSISKLDLTFFIGGGDQITLDIEYNSELFNTDTIDTIIKDTKSILFQLIDNLDNSISQIISLTKTSKEIKEEEDFYKSLIQRIDDK
ncbi:MAG: condensation domain-containing protein [Cytophagales bacterium]|nr:condensation domain-containing protein [Cytophagales bacterium]